MANKGSRTNPTPLFSSLLSSGLTTTEAGFSDFLRTSRLRFINITFLMGIAICLGLAGLGFWTGKPENPLLFAVFAGLLGLVVGVQRLYPHPALGSAVLLAVSLFLLVRGGIVGGAQGDAAFFAVLYPILAYTLHGRGGGTLAVIIYVFLYCLYFLAVSLGWLDAGSGIRTLATALLSICVCAVLSFLVADRHQRIHQNMLTAAYTDRLTGLPNRPCLMIDLARVPAPMLFLVNLDDFKEINTLFGFRVGDSVLEFVGGQLARVATVHQGRAYRLSGDEFAVLISQDTEIGRAERTADRIARELSAAVQDGSFTDANHEVMLRISVGVSFATRGDRTGLFPAADGALRSAKTSTRPYILSGDGALDRSSVETSISHLNTLTEALGSDRIFPFYQPISDNSSGQVTRYECLARIIAENGAVISPHRFLAVAKKTRLYPKITVAMLRKAFATFADADEEFSINLSVSDFTDPYVLQFIDLAVVQSPAVAQRVCFEILESEGIDNFEEAKSFIERMRRMGCKVALDDFGRGYSNFETVLKLDLDLLKIDGSLIRRIDKDNGSRVLVENIVSFCQRLGIKTVAEYVHSAEIYKIVTEMGIDYSQGHHVGKPIPALDTVAPVDAMPEEP